MRALVIPAALAAAMLFAPTAFAASNGHGGPGHDRGGLDHSQQDGRDLLRHGGWHHHARGFWSPWYRDDGFMTTAPSVIVVPANHRSTGYVGFYDRRSERLTLTDGERFVFPASFPNMRLRPGEKVSIAWRLRDGQRVGNQVTILS